MPTFRSNTTSNTTMTVNVYEVGRSGNAVTARVDWSVKLGSGTSNGSSSSNNRTLYIYRSDGVLLGSGLIKNSQAWSSSQTYSGSFVIAFDVGTTLSGGWNLYIQTSTSGTESCIWTNRNYCTEFGFGWSLYWTRAGAPYSPSLSPNPYENRVTFSWGPASAGVNNAIQTYRVYYRINYGGENLADVGNTTSWTPDVSGWGRGTIVDFYVMAVTQRGDNPWSGWSNAVTKNRIPNQPTSPGVPKTSYIPGDIIRVSFANTGDPDNNLVGFEAATDQNETIVGNSASGAATFVDVNTSGWPQGIQRRFRVRSYDAYGIRSPWSSFTTVVTLNTTPYSPEISFPAAGSKVYNKRPHILLAAGTTNDGPKHILCLNDGSEKTTATVSGFSCGANANLASGQKVVYQPLSELTAGTVNIKSRMYDSYLYSSDVIRSFNVLAFVPEDGDLTIPGMKIKAVHISSLQVAIGNLRAAYGLDAVSWTACHAGASKIGNAVFITEMQTALQGVIDRINGWDTSNSNSDISVAWINPSVIGGGVNRVKLRQAIEQLRDIVKQV